MPAIYYAREFAAAGGLISYASSFADFIRQAADLCWADFLKEEKAADLPVLQPTKFELVINPRRPRRRSASKCPRRYLPALTR